SGKDEIGSVRTRRRLTPRSLSSSMRIFFSADYYFCVARLTSRTVFLQEN
ncbi:MAG: hypothetical protein CFH05_00459, partial [Alphaproteobacteria bacterium MarineAlpha3_Bin4]